MEARYRASQGELLRVTPACADSTESDGSWWIPTRGMSIHYGSSVDRQMDLQWKIALSEMWRHTVVSTIRVNRRVVNWD